MLRYSLPPHCPGTCFGFIFICHFKNGIPTHIYFSGPKYLTQSQGRSQILVTSLNELL